MMDRRVIVYTALLGTLGGCGGNTESESNIAEESRALDSPNTLTEQARQLQVQIDDRLRSIPGARQLNQNQISSSDGKVILTFPLPGEQIARGSSEAIVTAGTPNCPYTYTCLYEHAFYGGWRLQFAKCQSQDLDIWGVRDQTTSWHNNQTPGTRSWVYNYNGFGKLLLFWTEAGAPSQSPNVGVAKNDQADIIVPCI